MRLLAMHINETRKHVKICLPNSVHYGLDGSNNLNVRDYGDFAAWRKGQQDVFPNCVEKIVSFEEKNGFLERNCSMFQKMREGRRKQKMQAGGGHVQKMRQEPAICGRLGRFVICDDL